MRTSWPTSPEATRPLSTPSVNWVPILVQGFAVAGMTNATQNATLVRKPEVSTGNGGDWATSAGTNEIDTEWIINPSDDWTDLDMHTFTRCVRSGQLWLHRSRRCQLRRTATEDDGSCIFIPNLTVQEIQTQGFSGTW